VTTRWPLIGRRVELDRIDRALADPATEGVVVFGPAGVGRSRLAEETRQLAERRGRLCLRGVASSSAAAMPLGALAHLLADDRPGPDAGSAASPPVDLGAAFGRVRAAVAAEADGRPVALVIDDLHLLDAASTTLVAQLVASRTAFLVGTVRTGDPLPDGIRALARADGVVTVDLAPLSRECVDTLLHLGLGGPLDGAAAARLWAACDGNVLLLHELVVGALESGALVDDGGVWSLDGPLLGTGLLRELVEARLAALSPAGRRAMEALAVCIRLAHAHLLAVAGAEALLDLEGRGMIDVIADRRRVDVVLAEAVHGEVLRSTLPVLRTAALLLDAAEFIERAGSRRRDDLLRIAGWRLEGRHPVDADLLLGAAHLAAQALDHARVATLAEASLRERSTAEAAWLLGSALYELGRFAEAEEVFVAAEARPGADVVAVSLAAARSTNLFWGCLRPEEAMAVSRRAQAVAPAGEERDVLVCSEASVLMFSGHPGEAIDRLDGLGDDVGPITSIVRAVVRAPALAVVGRTAEALLVAGRGAAEHAAIGNPPAVAHPATHEVNRALALMEAGRLAEARAVAAAAYERTLADGIAITRVWATTLLGRCALLEGRPATAARWQREAARLAGRVGFDGPRRLAEAGLAVALAQAGDGRGAAEAADLAESLAPTFGFLRAETHLGGAWAAVARGDTTAAAALLAEAAAEAEATGHLTSEAWLRHDRARLGHARDECERLEALAARCDGEMVGARAAHVRGLVDDDPDQLDRASRALEAVGALLLAAEASSAAADALRRRRQQRAAAAMLTRAAALAEACEGARTPGLAFRDAAVPLTAREREIALLAAAGIQSKQVAERLYLSVRTVDNHLQRIYRKLGVTSRAELAATLAEEDAP